MKANFIKLLRNRGFYILLVLGVGIVSIMGYVSGLKTVDRYEFPTFEAFSEADMVQSTSIEPTSKPTTATQHETYVPAYVPTDIAVSGVSDNTDEQPLWLILPVNGILGKDYSGDELLYSKTMEDWRVHTGVDINGNVGTPVKAAADGIVTRMYADDMMGSTVVIQHKNCVETVYSNLQTGELVEIGQEVTRGEVIGGIGVTAQGEIGDQPHLHFEVLLDGKNIDPFKLTDN